MVVQFQQAVQVVRETTIQVVMLVKMVLVIVAAILVAQVGLEPNLQQVVLQVLAALGALDLVVLLLVAVLAEVKVLVVPVEEDNQKVE